MSRLNNNSTPAERAFGCVFAETFEDSSKVVENNGTITGAPTVNFGATLDGSTDFVNYGPDLGNFESNDFSILIKDFKPTDDGNVQVIVAKYSGASYAASTSGLGWEVLFRADRGGKEVQFRFNNGTGTGNTATTTTVDFLDGNTHDIMILADRSASATIVIDGVANDTALMTGETGTYSNTGNLHVGRQTGTGTGSFYNGSVGYIKLFNNRLLTVQDALDYSNDNNSDYRNRAVLDLPCRMEEHDPTNVRTLDVSGNANHAQFGDGSTASTYPTKVTDGAGYTFDGTDYLVVSDTDELSIPTTGELTVGAWIKPSTLEFSDSTASGDGPYVHWMGKATAGGGAVVEYKFRMYNLSSGTRPNRISFYVFNAGGGEGAGSYFEDTLTVDQWIFVVGRVKTADDTLSIFRDGVLRDTDTLSGYSITPENTAADFRIGSVDLEGADNSFFEGRIIPFAVPFYMSELQIMDMYLTTKKQLMDN
jgi:hypothetical protein